MKYSVLRSHNFNPIIAHFENLSDAELFFRTIKKQEKLDLLEIQENLEQNKFDKDGSYTGKAKTIASI